MPDQSFREAMRRMTGPVCVITAGLGAQRTGATVTTAHSLSMDPEIMAVSINKSSSTYTAIVDHRAFCVNLLAADQLNVADRFSGRGGMKGPQRYEGAQWLTLESGAAALAGALASVDCVVEEIVVRHSHAVILGAVREVVLGAPTHGLVYRAGVYGAHGAALAGERGAASQ
jgi:flavin reductase (DIM6/NTAB) family NADH-FMN oxidoreductase RutF